MTEQKALVVSPRKEKALAIEGALNDRAETLRAILPATMDPTRFIRTATIAISKNPDLLECTTESLIRSVIEAAEIGIEPTGSLNRAWLVGYRKNIARRGDPPKWIKEAQLIVGWEGLCDLIRRGSDAFKVEAYVVYEGDNFAVTYGDDPGLAHSPMWLTADPLKITHAYAVAHFRGGGSQFVVMTHSEVESIRQQAQGRNGKGWTEAWGEMAKKTAVRRLSKFLGLTPEAQRAIERDDDNTFTPDEVAPQAKTKGLAASLKAQAAEITGEAVEGEVVEEPPMPHDDLDPRNMVEESAPVRTTCGAESDPALGDVDRCTLSPGHVGADGKPNPHQAEGGAIWPNKPGGKK